MPPHAISVPRRPKIGVALVAAVLAAACGGAAAANPEEAPAPAAEACLLGPGTAAGAAPVLAAAEGRDTALLSSSRARTPLGRNCAGRAVPRVAFAWSADSSRRFWTLVLPGAGEYARRWREHPEAAAALRWAGVTSVLPMDEQRLVVSFRSPQDAVPGVFADRALALPSAAGDSIPIRLMPGGGRDLRDALDRGADIVATADPAVLEYASTRPDLTSHPLPWNRTYVLLLPGGPGSVIPPPGDSVAFREALARDAVRETARPAEPPFWWEAAAGCPAPPPPPVAEAPAVVYPQGDPVARALAERFVATAAVPAAVARGVPDGELPVAIGRGAGAAYVVPVPRIALVPCRERASWPAGATILPLIETRPTVVLGAAAPLLTVDFDGGLLPRERP